MNNENQNQKSKDGSSGKEKVGQWLRKTREAAGVGEEKLCADLRISRSALDAVEAGQYQKLAGDPYVRALLGSIARYLNLDPQAVVNRYNHEVGRSTAAASAAPYADQAPKYRVLHKQVFFAVFVALLILIAFVTLLNRGENPVGVEPAPAAEDAGEGDAGAPESGSLAPDSVEGAKTDTVLPGASTGRRITIRPLKDSVMVRVVRAGRPEFKAHLRLGKQMQVPQEDTVYVYADKPRVLQVLVGRTEYVPDKDRFKIYRDSLSAF